MRSRGRATGVEVVGGGRSGNVLGIVRLVHGMIEAILRGGFVRVVRDGMEDGRGEGPGRRMGEESDRG